MALCCRGQCFSSSPMSGASVLSIKTLYSVGSPPRFVEKYETLSVERRRPKDEGKQYAASPSFLRGAIFFYRHCFIGLPSALFNTSTRHGMSLCLDMSIDVGAGKRRRLPSAETYDTARFAGRGRPTSSHRRILNAGCAGEYTKLRESKSCCNYQQENKGAANPNGE